MKTAWIEQEIKYDGSQLSSHFAYKTLGILGDSCVAFVGPCEVKLNAMVDLEDVRKNAPIYSPRMLHFILESFHLDLRATVLLQRLLIAMLKDTLQERGISNFKREGDDLFQNFKKLSVSIATRSPVSCLIHLGINIQTEGTPVPTVGLEELGIDAVEFGKHCLDRWKKEYEAVFDATYKVRGV